MTKSNSTPWGLKERLSLILSGQDSGVPGPLADIPVIRIKKQDFRLMQERLGLCSEIAPCSQGKALGSLPVESVGTPWVLLLDEGEELDPREMPALRGMVSQEPCFIWDLAVESLVQEEVLSDFEWVTTPDMARILGPRGRIHYLLEPRLLPRKALAAALRGEARKIEHRAQSLSAHHKKTGAARKSSSKAKTVRPKPLSGGPFQVF